jgi:hypothetical protein
MCHQMLNNHKCRSSAKVVVVKQQKGIKSANLHYCLTRLLYTKQRTLRRTCQLHSPQPLLRTHEHLPIFPEAEVCNSPWHKDCPHECPSSIPHLYPVAAARVHITMDIALDPVRPTVIGIRKDSPIHKERCARVSSNIEGVNSGSSINDISQVQKQPS